MVKMLVLFLFLSTLLLSYNPSIAQEKTKNNSNNYFKNKVVFAVMGGHNSCDIGKNNNSSNLLGLSFYDLFLNLKNKFMQTHPDTQVEVLMTCFGDSRPPYGMVSVVTSDHPRVIEKMQAAYLGKRIAQLAGDSLTPVYLIGHSYGAWTAMDIVTRDQGAAISIFGLFTIDPIDPTVCNSSFFGKISGVIHVTKGFLKGEGFCQGVPKNISSSLVQIPHTWMNFFEQEGRILRSDAIPGDGRLPENRQMGNYGKQGHHLISIDPEVWNDIGEMINQFEPL